MLLTLSILFIANLLGKGDVPLKLNAFTLKVIALVFMFVEQLGHYLPGILPQHVPLILQYPGRIVFPIFCFLSVESLFKTSSRRRYILRLFGWAVAMQVGNFLISWAVKGIFNPADFLPINQNILLSIVTGVSLVAVLDWMRAQVAVQLKILGGLAAVVLAGMLLFTEASFISLALYLIFYLFRGRKPALYIAYAALCVLSLVIGLIIYPLDQFWGFNFQWVMIAALPFLMLYNGERGPAKAKNLFYVFYPAHIWALFILSYVLNLRLPPAL